MQGSVPGRGVGRARSSCSSKPVAQRRGQGGWSWDARERVRGGEAGEINGAVERPWWQSLQKHGLLLGVKWELMARPGVGPRHDLTSLSKDHFGC